MTKDQYLRTVEQTGEEIDWERCPPDIQDFPQSVHAAVTIYNSLGNKVVPDIGFIGKDYSNLSILYEHNFVTIKQEKEWTLEILLNLEREEIKESSQRLKAQHDKARKK